MFEKNICQGVDNSIPYTRARLSDKKPRTAGQLLNHRDLPSGIFAKYFIQRKKEKLVNFFLLPVKPMDEKSFALHSRPEILFIGDGFETRESQFP